MSIFLDFAGFFFSLWWPSFVILFYIFSVVPTLIIKRSMPSTLFGPSYVDLSIFLTMGFIVSSFGLPIVLERTEIVSIFGLHICGTCFTHHIQCLCIILLLIFFEIIFRLFFSFIFRFNLVHQFWQFVEISWFIWQFLDTFYFWIPTKPHTVEWLKLSDCRNIKKKKKITNQNDL